MTEFYLHIKYTHMVLALASGAFFALRGACALAGLRWPNAALVRGSSYAIDVALLTAALLLVSLLPGAVFANGWLAMKLTLLVAYVVLGVFAMRRGRTPRIRALCYGLALLAFAQMYVIARTHHPLGMLYLAG